MTEMTTMETTLALDLRETVEVVVTDGLRLTVEETLMLQAVWTHAERVDWAVYDRLRQRVVAWPFPDSPNGEQFGRREGLTTTLAN
jgi:hypothetical protein